MLTLYKPSEAEIVRRNYERSYNEGIVLDYEAKIELVTGNRILNTEVTPIMGKNNRKYLVIVSKDITEREILKNEAAEEKELLRITLNSIGDGVVSTDEFGIIQALNPVAEEITGWRKEDAIGKRFEEVFHLYQDDDPAQIINPVQEVMEKRKKIKLASNTKLINATGKIIQVADSAAPIQTADGAFHGVVMVFRDVSAENARLDQIKYMSYHDQLTGLYNRRYIEKIMYQLDCEENMPLVVAMGDLNGLKLTNDVFGHKVGDALLKNAAELLMKNVRPNDIVARWGGDEFVLFMPKTTREEAEVIIERIKGGRMEGEGNVLNASITMGYAVKVSTACNLDEALRLAEEEMYHHKLLAGKSFRNRVINTLLVTLSENSNETKEHSDRLEYYSHTIGRRLKLSAKELNNLSLLALLHDIGKIGVDVSILQKPGPLTDGEWAIMKTHPEIGYRIANSITELMGISDLILSHHERWDGCGYPNRVAGESIPLLCRILAVVDAYDAMTNDRAYRKALGTEEAIEEIERNAGTQFDPKIAKIFVEILKEELILTL